MPISFPGSRTLAAAIAVCGVLLLFLTGCGGSGDDAPTSTPTSPLPTATSSPSPTATSTSPPSTAVPTSPSPTAMPSPTPGSSGAPRSLGEYDGVSFMVSAGSEATFTVEEQLASLPLPNDAVLRTSALSGEVHLDGRPSVIRIDLQELSSDQTFRDRYVRSRMFGEYPVAVFTVPDIGSIPDGLALGEEVTTSVDGSLEIHGSTFPLSFEIQARDDGDELFILGRATFTWDQLEIPRPTAQSVVSIEDEVRVEILLAVVPA